ncbi:MAG: DUF1080 domain-containing protein [Planctomycetaceae bacterium]|nr:DUF1080 domain-containing protein [Planctomycetaceae bacterium]
MKKIIICVLFVLFSSSFVIAQSGKPSAEETEKNVKILQSIFNNNNSTPTDAQLYDASQAVFRLTQIGTDAAVPELKKLLSCGELNTNVRTALINIGDAGIIALRESLNSIEGKSLIGVIESIGSVRDEKSVVQLIKLTQNSNDTVAKSAILALGKIASVSSISALKSILQTRNSQFRLESANALLIASERVLDTKDNKTAIEIYSLLFRYKEFQTVWSAAVQSYLLLNPQPQDALQLFKELLISEDEIEFRTASFVAVRIESPQVSKLILENLSQFPNNKKAILIEILGIRKERSALPVLIEIASSSSEDVTVKTSAIKALGEIGDMIGIETIFNAINSSEKTVSKAGKESLAKLQGSEFNVTIIKNLDAKNKILRLTALKIIEERRIAEAINKVKILFDDSDIEIKSAAYRAFSQIIVATAADLEPLLYLLQKSDNSEEEKNALKDALRTVCRKIQTRDESVNVIEKFKNINDIENKKFLLDLLFLIGNNNSCKVTAEFARSNNNEIADHATMLLGKWISSEAAPFLIDLAENHPSEKYRVRTLSGYIRIIRQFGLPLEQKYEMIKKAESTAKRGADKKRIAELKENIQTQLKAKPIFDGKTFEGWEGNLSFFRIADNAIVAGTLEKRIPQNEFLCTTKEYENFTLHLEIKILGKGANAGIQFRSKRLSDDKKRPNEVAGYQADMTDTEKFWGCLYDESRRGKFLAEANLDEIKTIFRKNDWNELKIVCKDDNIKLYVNGKMTVDYTETDKKIPRKGIIGLQIHSGGPSEAWYRNIRIEE